jgi:rhodanese-related sulfurtransferase
MNANAAPPLADSVPLPISAATAQRRQLAGALLVDVRPQIARHQGSITDALTVYATAIAEKFNPTSAQRIPGLHRDRDIVVCSINSRRALPVAAHLTRLGYHHVYFLAGGYTAWQRHAENRATLRPVIANETTNPGKPTAGNHPAGTNG